MVKKEGVKKRRGHLVSAPKRRVNRSVGKVKNVATNSVRTSVKKSAKKSVGKSAKKSVGKNIKTPVGKNVKTPVKKSAKKPVGKNVKKSSLQIKKDMELFATGVERLKALERELDSIDTRGFSKEEGVIRSKLKNVSDIPTIERLIKSLALKVRGKYRPTRRRKSKVSLDVEEIKKSVPSIKGSIRDLSRKVEEISKKKKRRRGGKKKKRGSELSSDIKEIGEKVPAIESGIKKLSKKIDEYSEDRQGDVDVGVGILVDSDFNGFLKNLKIGLSDRVRTKEKEIDEVLKKDLIRRESKFKEKYEGLVREYNLKKRKLESDMERKYALKVKASLRDEVSLEFDKKLREKFNSEKKRLDREYKGQLRSHANEVLDRDEVALRKRLESEFLRRSRVLDANFRKEQSKIRLDADKMRKKIESERKRGLNQFENRKDALSSQRRDLAGAMTKFELQKKEERRKLHEEMLDEFHKKLDSEIIKREKVIRAKLNNEFELKLKKGIQEHEEMLKKKKMDLELEIQNKMKSLLN